PDIARRSSPEPGDAEDRTAGAGRSGASGFEVHMREYRGRFWPAASIESGVQALSLDGCGLVGRDAGLGALCARPGLCRRENLARLARRISGHLEAAASLGAQGVRCPYSVVCVLFSDHGSGAFRWLTKGEP